MKNDMYDYLIVGAGLFGCVFAHEAKKKGKRCLVIDRRQHIGGTFTRRKWTALQYTGMGHISSTLQTGKSGITCSSL